PGGGCRRGHRLGERGARVSPRRSRALQERRDEAAAVLPGTGDEAVARQGGPQAGATGARGEAAGLVAPLAVAPRALRLRLLPVGERWCGQSEVVLRRLEHAVGILPAPLLKGLAPHLLGEPQRLIAGGIEPPRRRVPLAQ